MRHLERGDLPPAVVVPPPGPESRRLSGRLESFEAPGISTVGPRGEPALVWREALGANVLDVDGNLFVDLTAGFGVAAVGHRHPAIVAAVVRQSGELLHGLGDVAAHPTRVALAERLAGLAPVDDARVHFAVSGADAVEIALKAALAATGRPGVLAFDPGYHGVTLGALAVTSRAEFRAPFAAALRPGVVRLPFGAADELVAATLDAEPIGAAIVEPVVGREGVLVPPPGWLAALAEHCRAHGVPLVVDEIFTGLGRTGARFAVEHEGVRPDLLCCGKALGGGMPIAAAIGRAELFEPFRREGEALHTGTFVAHPLACAAALAALELLEQERLVERAAAIGERVARALGPTAVASATELRGRGALWGLAVGGRERAYDLSLRLARRGFLALAGGAAGDVVQIAPPLTIPFELLDLALAAVAEELERLESSRGRATDG
ncbi:MAG: aspartate aminotransferase family protein [Holophagales bacterium]|nr:aspartate aminotransferase family protein [Holophagales bacterium]